MSDETFYRPQDVLNGIALESGRPVQWVREENYKFRLHRYIPAIRKWLLQGSVVCPTNRINDLLPFLDDVESNQQELSVSRRGANVKWGIPVPGDDDQMIYVWLDALTNYLTVQNFPNSSKLSETVHVIGKDILK